MNQLTEAIRLGKSIDIVRHYCPKFEVRDKVNSRLQRLLARILAPWNDEFMKSYWTTVGFTTWRPSRIEEDAWLSIFHEGVHAIDAKKMTRLMFFFLYLFPLSFVPLTALLLGLLSSWWFSPLALLLCIPKLPDPFRFIMEMRAYRVNLAIDYWMVGEEAFTEDNISWYAQQMYGPTYYFIWPFKGSLNKILEKMIHEVKSGELFKDGYYIRVYDFLREEGLLRVNAEVN